MFNATYLHELLEHAGLSIEGCDSEGTIHWHGKPSEEDIETAKTVLTLYSDPPPAKALDVTPVIQTTGQIIQASQAAVDPKADDLNRRQLELAQQVSALAQIIQAILKGE